ncbi:hypothetical protein C8Q80DRAFT_1155544 [Daedaleopsis nitida]|nr:hypothetical protein C8Q80DRAFT_1155544 [Daedaleopsis nitida]
MGPVTRSTNRPSSSSRRGRSDKESNDTKVSREEDGDAPNESGTTTLQGLLERALKGAKSVERENKQLKNTVKALESKLARVQEADDIVIQPTKGKNVAQTADSKEVQRLKKQVSKLEKSNEKYRQRLHELSMREAKSEAKDLVEDAEFEVGDSAHKMRKLLREFRELMETNTLGEKEECPICLDSPLQLKKCQSLPCQHIVCNDCVKKLKPEADGYADDVDSISCPVCRVVCRRDELEPLELTPSAQWDALLEVAKQWAKMDVRREEDTTEEEAEEDFIESEQEASTRTSEERNSTPEPDEEALEPQTPSRLRRRNAVFATSPSVEPEGVKDEATGQSGSGAHLEASTGTSAPEASGQPARSGYSASPKKDKRKILGELVEARAKKPRL